MRKPVLCGLVLSCSALAAAAWADGPTTAPATNPAPQGSPQTSLITRGSRVLVPSGRDILRAGDQILAVAARGQVGQVEDRLRSVSRGGRLARWYEGHEPTNPLQTLGVRRRTT